MLQKWRLTDGARGYRFVGFDKGHEVLFPFCVTALSCPNTVFTLPQYLDKRKEKFPYCCFASELGRNATPSDTNLILAVTNPLIV